MNYIYTKINHQTYKGFELFYRSEIDPNTHQATEFNDKYEYFYKSPYNNDTLKSVGKFVGVRIRSSNLRYNDYDYDVYEFTNDYISCSEKKDIYCKGITESGENMIEIAEMKYLKKYPVYFHNVKEI